MGIIHPLLSSDGTWKKKHNRFQTKLSCDTWNFLNAVLAYGIMKGLCTMNYEFRSISKAEKQLQ